MKKGTIFRAASGGTELLGLYYIHDEFIDHYNSRAAASWIEETAGGIKINHNPVINFSVIQVVDDEIGPELFSDNFEKFAEHFLRLEHFYEL